MRASRAMVARLVIIAAPPRTLARGGAALADHAQGTQLCADRWPRRRAHDLAARVARGCAQLGLSLLLAARCRVHAECVAALWLPRRSARLAAVAGGGSTPRSRRSPPYLCVGSPRAPP